MKPKTPKEEAMERIKGFIQRIYKEGLAEDFADVNVLECILEEAISLTKQQERERIIKMLDKWWNDLVICDLCIDCLNFFKKQIKEEK